MKSKEDIINNKKHVNKEIRGIYFLIHNDEIVYVGQSINIYYRISTHDRYSEKIFDYFYYIETNGNLDQLEIDYIIKFKPKYNKEIPTNNRFLSIAELRKKFNNVFPSKLKKFIKQYNIDVYNKKYDVERFHNFIEWLNV